MDPEAEHLLEIEAANKMHCNFLTMLGFDGERLLLKVQRRKAERYNITKANTRERQDAIAKATTSGQLFYNTQGQHFTSNDFFRAQALKQKKEDIDKLEKKKKIALAKLAIKEQRDSIIEEKGEPTEATINAFNAKEMGILYKYKKGSNPKGKKAEVLLAYLAAPAPEEIDVWSAEEEAELERLKTEEIPMADTQVAVAATQQANAVENNLELLSEDQRRSLLGAIQRSFDVAELDSDSELEDVGQQAPV
ncbi:unknown protein [Seminavis robusta]|uniref:Uncharacterized protein n=1 Tax=Seminavis robusta TaxID=568900 RepID=A0A9N8EE85_9STRA|nr:unknown protein [Seminavis robusta]|eukprot:Sro866_g212970.1 n/a (250) ;mRNA; f:12405-13154